MHIWPAMSQTALQGSRCFPKKISRGRQKAVHNSSRLTTLRRAKSLYGPAFWVPYTRGPFWGGNHTHLLATYLYRSRAPVELPNGSRHSRQACVSAGTTLIDKYAAKGIQIYACAAKETMNERGFKARKRNSSTPRAICLQSTTPIPPGKPKTTRRSSAGWWRTSPLRRPAPFPGCCCRRNPRESACLPARASSSGSAHPAEPGRPTLARRQAPSSVSTTQRTISFTNEVKPYHGPACRAPTRRAAAWAREGC